MIVQLQHRRLHLMVFYFRIIKYCERNTLVLWKYYDDDVITIFHKHFRREILIVTNLLYYSVPNNCRNGNKSKIGSSVTDKFITCNFNENFFIINYTINQQYSEI